MSGFMRVLVSFNIVKTHWVLNWDSLLANCNKITEGRSFKIVAANGGT